MDPQDQCSSEYLEGIGRNGESMILIKEDFPNVIELPKIANHGAKTLVLIAFHDWMAVYLCGNIRCTIEHDIASNGVSIVAPVKMIMTRKYATNSKEAISTLIDMVTQRDIH